MPTIVSLIDENIDISFLLDSNEEESKEKEPSSKDLETKIVHFNTANISTNGLEISNFTSFYLRNYSRPYLNLLSPPPEQSVL